MIKRYKEDKERSKKSKREKRENFEDWIDRMRDETKEDRWICWCQFKIVHVACGHYSCYMENVNFHNLHIQHTQTHEHICMQF